MLPLERIPSLISNLGLVIFLCSVSIKCPLSCDAYELKNRVWRPTVAAQPTTSGFAHIKPFAGCGLYCYMTKQVGYDVWQCHWRNLTANCTKITRRMMAEAVTLDPQYPFLINASHSAKFGIAFLHNMSVTQIDDGFLKDYPVVRLFSIQLNHEIQMEITR